MLRAIENMGIEMSFGIIFIGNGELSKKDYARYIEKHKLSEEYIQQSTSFLTTMREMLQNIKNTSQYEKYLNRYEFMVKSKKLVKEDFLKIILNRKEFYGGGFDIILKDYKTFSRGLEDKFRNDLPLDDKYIRGHV